MNGFLDLKSPNFDPKHDFLSSIEAEIISLLPKKVTILIFVTFGPSNNILRCSPSKLNEQNLEAWLKKCGCFICPVTMFNIIVFMLIPFRAVFQINGSHIDFF